MAVPYPPQDTPVLEEGLFSPEVLRWLDSLRLQANTNEENNDNHAHADLYLTQAQLTVLYYTKTQVDALLEHTLGNPTRRAFFFSTL